MVTAMDEAIGNITKALEAKGMFDNTLIIFTADVSIVKLSTEVELVGNIFNLSTPCDLKNII
jgi:membrane-anchored protein YejM (alkaline phosphatase superfamily)